MISTTKTRRALRLLPALVLIAFATGQQAAAYTDPGTGALIWQLVAAGAVGLLFYFRKVTTWLKPKKKAEAASGLQDGARSPAVEEPKD
ncbi:MAG: hypothetical protein ACRD8O_05000 [Bryobacteraceae bacterium]